MNESAKLQKPESSAKKVPFVEKTPSIGGSDYQDVANFDDMNFATGEKTNLLQLKITDIKFWYGEAEAENEIVLNGIQITYKNLVDGKSIKTEARYGENNLKGSQDFHLNDDEYLDKLTLRAKHYVHRVELYTTLGRSFKIGGEDGDIYCLDFGKDNHMIVGTLGGYGKHLYNLGVYHAKLTDINYYRRREYILMRESLQSGKLSQDIANILQFTRHADDRRKS